MCKYGYKTENARFGMCAAIAKQVRGDAVLRRRRKLCFLGGLLSQPARLRRYGSSFQKVLRYFLGALFVRFSVFDSVRIAGRVLVSAPARGSARVTGRRQPPRQLCRRLVSKTSTRLALTPVYLPHIDRINIDVKFFRNNAFHDLDMIILKQGRIIVKNNKFV